MKPAKNKTVQLAYDTLGKRYRIFQQHEGSDWVYVRSHIGGAIHQILHTKRELARYEVKP